MCKCHCHWLGKLAFALIIIGALNWGLVGIFNFDLVAAIFGTMSVVSRIIYIVVGVSALVKLFMHCGKGCGCCKGACKDGKCMPEEKMGGTSGMQS